MRCTTKFFAALAAVAALSCASLASAATFIVDSNLSSLTLGANLSGTEVLFPQSPGSLTTALGGTLDIDFTPGSSVQFLGGGTATFALQPIDPQPGINGVPGTAPGNYGGSVNAFGGLASGPAAGRDLIAEGSSGVIPVAGVAFDASQVTLGLTQGFLDFDLVVLGNPTVGRADISGNSAANQAIAGTATQVGLLQTITIPVNVGIPIDLNGIIITGTLDGIIVATFVVPEPSSLVMLSISLVGLVAIGRRRFRNA